MITTRSTHGPDQVEIDLRTAAEEHGGRIAGKTRLDEATQAFALSLPELYGPLQAADSRFDGVFPLRVTARAEGGATVLTVDGYSEFCRDLSRPDLHSQAQALENEVRGILEQAAAGEHTATEDQMNTSRVVPQRIDARGTKVEESAGVGSHDSKGG